MISLFPGYSNVLIFTKSKLCLGFLWALIFFVLEKTCNCLSIYYYVPLQKKFTFIKEITESWAKTLTRTKIKFSSFFQGQIWVCSDSEENTSNFVRQRKQISVNVELAVMAFHTSQSSSTALIIKRSLVL